MSKLFKININLTTLIIIGVVVFFTLFGGFGYHFRKISKLNNQLNEEIKLRNALIDTMTVYRNEANELVAEKLTLQADLSKLKDLNESLTNSQRNLLNRIEQLDKDKRVITAALIEANMVIDSLLHSGNTIIDPENATITFTDKQEYIEYDIQVTNVVQADTLTNSDLHIRRLTLPNETFIEFHWQLDRRANYPIAFSVTNTSPFYQINNIESYAIPQLQKEDLDPSTWNNITQWFERNGGVVIKVGVAGTVGYLIGRSVK
jgi:hypothetical protein